MTENTGSEIGCEKTPEKNVLKLDDENFHLRWETKIDDKYLVEENGRKLTQYYLTHMKDMETYKSGWMDFDKNPHHRPKFLIDNMKNGGKTITDNVSYDPRDRVKFRLRTKTAFDDEYNDAEFSFVWCKTELVNILERRVKKLETKLDFFQGLFEKTYPIVDEFEMIIRATRGRDQYTRFSRAILMGFDGKNYSKTEYGTWTSSSNYGTLQSHGPGHLADPNSKNYLHFNNTGKKWLKWKAKDGVRVRLQSFQIHSGFKGQFNVDLPKEVEFLLKEGGEVKKNIYHRSAYNHTSPIGNGQPLQKIQL